MFSGSYWKPTRPSPLWRGRRVGITEAAQTANKLDAAIVGQGYIGKT